MNLNASAPLTSYQQDLWNMGGLGRVTIFQRGFDKLIRDVESLEANWDQDSKGVLAKAARMFRVSAQERSPYLYGILRGAHFDEVNESADGPYGLVSISAAHHPILGGYADEYGPRIHAEDRPWFAWTIEQESSRIMGEVGSEMLGVYGKHLSGSGVSGIF